eukprot:COSAG02_NODE_15757_length_1143_cov_1.441571_1_plen_74_part_00
MWGGGAGSVLRAGILQGGEARSLAERWKRCSSLPAADDDDGWVAWNFGLFKLFALRGGRSKKTKNKSKNHMEE